jgi:hypothetical protein
MSIRLPLVIVNGQVQQLQNGDTIVAASATFDARTATNAETTAPLTAGTPIYTSGSAAVKRAEANDVATSEAIGIWMDASTAPAASGVYAAGGVAVVTTAQWDVVTGGTGGLTSGSKYYLDPSGPGKLTLTAPTAPGQLVVLVGRALSPTDLELSLTASILL